jgi:hypothetical protein
MKGMCFAYRDSNAKCESNYSLHTILFFNPTEIGVQLVQVCSPCYERITKELNNELNQFTRKRDNMRVTAARERKLARDNDNLYYTDTRRYRIDGLSNLIKEIAMNQCRNELCRQNLRQLPIGSKVYSVSTYRPYGKRHHTFYLCSLKCFKRMKAMFGVLEKEPIRQQSLDNILVK